jgi:DNA-binding MarR family transcriptional regulator
MSDLLSVFRSLLGREGIGDGLTTRDLQVIAFCCEMAEPVSQAEIAQGLALSRSRVSRLTRALQARGLLKLSEFSGDARMILVTPTDAGRAVHARVSKAFAQANAA